MPNYDELIPSNTKFLITCQQRYELDAASEVWHCLYAVGYGEDIEIYFIRKRDRTIAGLIAIVFNGDPIEAVQKIRNYLSKKPWILRYTHKIIPVELVTSSLETLLEFVSERARLRISDKDTWRITVSKHASKISSRKMIERIATIINRGKVSLEKPQWIINIEIIRNTFLVAVVKPEWIIRKKEFAEIIRRKKPLDYL